MAKNSIGMALSLVNKIAGSDVVNKLKLKKPAERIAYYSTRTGFQLLSTANESLSQVKNLLGSPLGWQDQDASKALFDPRLSEEQQMIQESVKRFASDVLSVSREECEVAVSVAPQVQEAFAELELQTYALPPSLDGGQEHPSATTSVVIAEAMAYGDLGMAVALLSNYSVIQFLRRWATPAQQAFYLKRLQNDPTYKAALAINEPTVLFNPHNLATKASNVKNGILLNGVKSMVAMGGEADLLLIAAQLPDHATGVFAVETNTPGVTLIPKNGMGLKSAGLTQVILEDVLVDDSVLLRDEHFHWPDVTSYSGLMWCAAAIGVSQAVLDYVIPYCNGRSAFGEPITHRQSVAFMIATMATDIEAMRLVVHRAAALADQGGAFQREAYLARHLCQSKVLSIASDGVQLLGGHGFTKEHPVERWYRDLNAVPVCLNNLHA